MEYKKHIMMLCKRGTNSLLSNQWANDWHIVNMYAVYSEKELTQELYKYDLNYTWATNDPYDKNIPDRIQKTINENGLHIIY